MNLDTRKKLVHFHAKNIHKSNSFFWSDNYYILHRGKTHTDAKHISQNVSCTNWEISSIAWRAYSWNSKIKPNTTPNHIYTNVITTQGVSVFTFIYMLEMFAMLKYKKLNQAFELRSSFSKSDIQGNHYSNFGVLQTYMAA